MRTGALPGETRASYSQGHYRIVYMAKGDLLHILGVFHGAMELKRYFAG